MTMIQTPFPQFFDGAGNNLDAGFVYIGEAGSNPETTPIQVFWDAALSQPAAQPLRTINGHIVNGFSPTTVFTSVDAYSITVRDFAGQLIFSALSFAPLPYLPAGPGATLTTFQDKLREVISIEDFGASPTETAVVNTAAVHAAIAYASSMGGGIVRVPAKNYAVSELNFGTASNVILEGMSNGYDYGAGKTASTFTVTTGVWGVRLPPTGNYCGLRDIGVVSNGLVNTVSPYLIATLGVEYGVLVETGSTIMERVSVYGFQHGCVQANGGNSNIYNQCAFVWNTRSGFSCTPGTASAYALYHPNLTAPTTLIANTVYTMTSCIMRRNGWGIILRDGVGTFRNLVSESNIFGGLIEWVGASDSGIGGCWDSCYFENNWISFSPASIAWAASSLTGNKHLLESAGVSIALVDNANNAISDFGYQVIIGGSTAGTTNGPGYQKFTLNGNLQSSQKGIFIKQGFKNVFDRCSITGGDQTNLCKFSYPSGGFLANQTHFYNFNGTLPASLGNRGMIVNSEASAPDGGGLTAAHGYFRGLAGSVKFPAAQTASADLNTLDDYEEGPSGTFTPTPTNLTIVGTPTYTCSYTKIGNWVSGAYHITSTTSTAATAGLTFFDLPFTPAHPSTCTVSDGGAISKGNGILLTNGNMYVPTWAANADIYIGFSYPTAS